MISVSAGHSEKTAVFSECPAGTFLSYNGGDSYCLAHISPVNCDEIVTACQSEYGENSTLAYMTSLEVMIDVIAVASRYNLADLQLLFYWGLFWCFWLLSSENNVKPIGKDF